MNGVLDNRKRTYCSSKCLIKTNPYYVGRLLNDENEVEFEQEDKEDD